MRSLLISLLAGAAIAAPAPVPEADPVPAPQNLPFGGANNDIVRGTCKGNTLIFARGSIEGGNMGMVVGPQFANALGLSLGGNLAIQGVEYPADIVGAVTGAIASVAAVGSRKMADLTKQAWSKCPGTKVILSGYSQGAEQVRGALSLLGGDAGKIAAVVTFGDPMQMLPFTGIGRDKGLVICDAGDPVCLGGINIAAHLAYGATGVGKAVDFVKKVIGTGGTVTAGAQGGGGLLSGLNLPFNLGGGQAAAPAPAPSAAPQQGGGLLSGLNLPFNLPNLRSLLGRG